MSISLSLSADLARQALTHLADAEAVGFFLADFDRNTFRLHTWRGIDAEQLEVSADGHALLSDEATLDAIKWAHAAQASLVEVHSHGRWRPAAFSGIDVAGFTDWVPGVRWRLRGAPYAAVVVADGTVDAWAWLDDSPPVQITAVFIDGEVIETTGATMARLREQNDE
jgi:hypothetical protein